MKNIQVSHLSKSYGMQEVLRDISLTMNDGEIIGLLGENGSGKSTLLKILVGEESPDSGSVSISPKGIKIGYLPQVIDDDSPRSSGEKTVKLLKEILDGNPDVLFLDEPTNHLDFDGLQWLETVVKGFQGLILLISHDRYFLDKTVNKIIELEEGQIEVYGGNYSFYVQQKKIQAEANERKYYQQQKRLKKLEERAEVIKNKTQQLEHATTGSDHYVRRKAAKAAVSALSMEKRIKKELAETTIEKPKVNLEMKVLFAPKHEGGEMVAQLNGVGFKSIVRDLSLMIRRGQRIALIGDNGCGKTTLIKLILEELLPDQGEVTQGKDIEVGYLSQEHRELDSENIVADELAGGTIDKTQIYWLLNRFLLPIEKINQQVRLLSSGEKARLLLAKIMTRGSNFIVLDEPTNHLDIPSREAIEESLANYPGTLLVVSHDRYFLEKIGVTNYLKLEEGKLIEI